MDTLKKFFIFFQLLFLLPCVVFTHFLCLYVFNKPQSEQISRPEHSSSGWWYQHKCCTTGGQCSVCFVFLVALYCNWKFNCSSFYNWRAHHGNSRFPLIIFQHIVPFTYQLPVLIASQFIWYWGGGGGFRLPNCVTYKFLYFNFMNRVQKSTFLSLVRLNISIAMPPFYICWISDCFLREWLELIVDGACIAIQTFRGRQACCSYYGASAFWPCSVSCYFFEWIDTMLQYLLTITCIHFSSHVLFVFICFFI